MKKNEISFLNVLFCLIVIFIHICSEPVTSLEKGTFEHAVIFALWKLSGFVVQGFVMLSGAKMFLSKKEESYSSYISKRASRIVLPYVFAVLVYYFYFLWRNYFGFDIAELLKYIVRGDLAAQFYFVVVIVQFYLLKHLWEFLVKKVPCLSGVLISLGITAFGILFFGRIFGTYNDRVFTSYLIYWVLGCYIGKNYERFAVLLKKYKWCVTLFYALIAVLEVSCAYFGTLSLYAAETLHIAYCLSAVMFSFVLASGLADKVMKIKLAKTVNAVSYYIYLWHVLIIFAANGVMDNLGIVSVGTRFILRAFCAYVLSVLFCSSYSKIKGKIRG